MRLETLRAHLAADSRLWAGRTTDYQDEDDTHLTAWAWVERPDDVELAGAQVQVRHHEHTRGQWVTVVESIPASEGALYRMARAAREEE